MCFVYLLSCPFTFLSFYLCLRKRGVGSPAYAVEEAAGSPDPCPPQLDLVRLGTKNPQKIKDNEMKKITKEKMKGHFVNSKIVYETKGCLCIDDFKAFPVKPRILRSGNFGGTRQFQVAKCVFTKLLGTYLIFVNFRAPPHYLAL